MRTEDAGTAASLAGPLPPARSLFDSWSARTIAGRRFERVFERCGPVATSASSDHGRGAWAGLRYRPCVATYRGCSTPEHSPVATLVRVVDKTDGRQVGVVRCRREEVDPCGLSADASDHLGRCFS